MKKRIRHKFSIMKNMSTFRRRTYLRRLAQKSKKRSKRQRDG
jgi:hypothetical protein